MVRLTVPEPESSGEALARLLRLQTDFVARLSEETMRYLRGLQGIVGPAAPGTIVTPRADEVLAVEGRPGDAVRIAVEIRNEQRVHCAVGPMVSPLVAETGATWFPDAAATPAYLLIGPQDTQALTVDLKIPVALPAGEYRGAVLVRAGGTGAGVVVRVLPSRSEPTARTTGPTASAPDSSRSRPRRTARQESPARRQPTPKATGKTGSPARRQGRGRGE